MHCTQHDDTGYNYVFGKTWIYPTNLPVRKYQKDIVHEALFKNTMVCLPTGLGKTFIAAVVMYNFFRWYPSGKIVFMATTKPLVKQQVDACYKIVAIPSETTAELTGNVLKQNRESIWGEKRVFFLTPQVLQNDLETIDGLGTKIRCIVIDEAHRARGNHAYCEVISKLMKLNLNFRVLALTATPASNITEVINVCKQLLISHLEVRTEESVDVAPYLHHKTIETIVLKLDGKLAEVIEEYKKILDTYLRILVENNVIHSNFSSLHKGRLFYLSKEFQEKNTHNRSTDKYKLITKVFAICTILYHAYDLLLRHGMRCFAKFMEDSINKPLLSGSSYDIQQLVQSINEYLGAPLLCDKLPDGSHLKLPDSCKFGHPKFYKLREIVKNHFTNNDANSKVIIFCEYRDSVGEVYASLLNQDSIKPKMFMGQSSITQKQQVNIIDSFRRGCFNTLISTCIGEEGIDVGFVDMVICFDISNKSSVRFIQRIGRTGRDRNGKVMMLVSEGREQQVLKECLVEKQHLCDTLLQARHIDNQLYKNDRRMIPEDVNPVCQELFIAPKKTKLTSYFKSAAGPSTDSLTLDNSIFLLDFTNLIPKKSLTSNEDIAERNSECFQFNKNLYLQRSQHCVHIASSRNSKILIDLMRQVEYARYNIPLGQASEPEIKGAVKRSNRVAAKKQTDIRNMFKQCSQAPHTCIEEKPQELDTQLEETITNILANIQECEFCHRFENTMNFKRELAPIGNPNLSIELKFDLSSVTLLQNNINIDRRKTKEEHVPSVEEAVFNNSDINYEDNKQVISKEFASIQKSFSDLLEESPLKEEHLHSATKKLALQKSPDLFDDDFPDLISNIDFDAIELEDVKNSNVSDNIRNIGNPHQQNVEQSLEVENEIIEASPSPLINKRKASDSCVGSAYRSRKRIKFDVTDIFDIQPKPRTLKKILKISTSDILDFDYSNTFTLETPNAKAEATESHIITQSRNQTIQEENISFPSINQIANKQMIIEDIFVSPSVIKSMPRRKKNITSGDIWDSTLDKSTPTNSDTFSTSESPSPIVHLQTKPSASTDLSISREEILDTTLFHHKGSVNLSALKFNSQKKPHASISSLESEEETQSLQCTASLSSLSSIDPNDESNVTKPRKVRRVARHFIDSQAEVSSDEVHSDDEHISTQDDIYDASFVDDDDAAAIPCTQTQAMYLQSVRSPALRPLVFKRPAARHVDDTVFDETIDLTYAKDTFCIDDSDEPIVLDESLDELERAEMELDRRRKAKRAAKEVKKGGQRRRILRIESDSD